MTATQPINIHVNSIYLKRAWNCADPRVFFFGGAGSGKSAFAIQWLVLKYFIQPPTETPERILFVRKVAKTIKNSLFEPVEQTLKDLGLWRKMQINKTDKTILNPTTGNQIIMTGLDDPEKIKSIYGITKIFFEEISEGEEEDLLQLELRMRGSGYAGTFQIIGCFNPVSDKHWLVKHVEPFYLPSNQQPTNVTNFKYLNDQRTAWRFANTDSEGNQTYTTVLNTNYKHNSKLDAAYIRKLKLLASIDNTYAQVYEHGRWGQITDGNQYAHKFKENVHVAKVDYIRGQPIHFTVDFNVSPHMTGLCAQLIYQNNRYQVNVFKAFALPHPENEAYYLGTNFVANFEDVLRYGVFLYGDASGNNRLGVSETKSLFHDVLKGFGKYADYIEKRVPNSNPRYDKIATGAMGRKTFTNAIFSGELPIHITIDPSCIELITDLRQCTQDANGKLAKPKNKHGYEERGHALQALEYLFCHKDSLAEYAMLD